MNIAARAQNRLHTLVHGRNPPLLLKKLFGLTPTEARIAKHLTSGDTPAQAAQSLNIAISTARTHIDAIFRKTEVSRQADLIRLLVKLPSMPD